MIVDVDPQHIVSLRHLSRKTTNSNPGDAVNRLACTGAGGRGYEQITIALIALIY
jgi:hypothetical protein